MLAPAVFANDLVKVFEPTPLWMRTFMRAPSRSAVIALDGVTFSVETGQICAVIGPNGAGKSTLFRALTGLIAPTRGNMSVLGLDPVVDAFRIRRQIGFMPAEDRTLFLRHNSRENLLFHGRLQGIQERKLRRRIDDVLELVGLGQAGNRAGFTLSSGMRARLMLARALLHEPRVLILDEPTGSIDPIGAYDFLELIIRVTAESGAATLLSSHRLEEIDSLRDNILLLDRGRVVFWGNLDHVKDVAEHKTFEVHCVDVEAANRVARTLRAQLSSNAVSQDGLIVSFPSSERFPIDLSWLTANTSKVESVSLRKRSLRETIAALLAEQSDQ